MAAEPRLPNRLQYPLGLQPLKLIVGAGAAVALLTAVATNAVGGGAYFVLCLLALVLAVDWFFGRAGSRRTRQYLQVWALARYDVVLTATAARALSTPARDSQVLIGDWTSQPASVLHQNESGASTYVEVRLASHENGWFLYSPDYGNELPQVVGEGAEQELSATLSPLMGEVLESGGMYCVVSTEADGTRGGLRVTDNATGREIELLWSDALRAELWLASIGATRGDGSMRVEHRAGKLLVDDLLPYMSAENVWVGLNWGAEGATAFEADDMRTFLSRYF